MTDRLGAAEAAPGRSRDRSAGSTGLADRGRVGMLLAAVPGAWLLLFLATPLGMLLLWSVQTPSIGIEFQPNVSLDSYRLMSSTGSYWRVLAETVATATAVAGLSVVLSYPIAYALAVFTSGRRRYLLLLLALLPFLTGYLLRLFAWRLLLGREGLLNHTLQFLGLTDGPVYFLLFSRAAVVLVLVYVWVPWAALPLFVRLEQLDPSLRHAASDLGANGFRRFVRVTLPLSMPGVYVAFLFVFIPTLGDFATPATVGGTGGVMLGNLIQGMLRVLAYPSGAVLSVLLLAVAFLAMAVGARGLRTMR